ncbi:alpha amylase C-terminal domain-containing protein [Streptococcus iniae]
MISKLAPLRKTNPALSYGTTEQRWINDDVLVFERKFGNNVALVAINRNQTNVFTIDNMKTSLPAGKHEDVLGKLMKGNSLTVSQSGDVETFELQPGEVAVWSSMKSSEHPQLGDVDPSMGISGNELTLVGQGFGSSKGQVNFGAIQAEVLSWSDTMIKIKIPEMAAG